MDPILSKWTASWTACSLGLNQEPADKKITMIYIQIDFFSVGPLAASVAASEWGLYFGGVFDGCPYEDNIAVNHAGTALYVSIPKDVREFYNNLWGWEPSRNWVVVPARQAI
jgi:hypothetical protein